MRLHPGVQLSVELFDRLLEPLPEEVSTGSGEDEEGEEADGDRAGKELGYVIRREGYVFVAREEYDDQAARDD